MAGAEQHPLFELPRPLVIAHRGASYAAPENTLPAFGLALAEGAQVLESDVRMTADRLPVLIHDATLDRTTDGTGEVALFDLDELANLDAGARFAGGAGYRDEMNRPARIPALAAALATFPEAFFNLELKDGSAAAIDAVLAVVAAARAERRVLLTAEDDGTMAALRQRVVENQSDVALGASRGDVETALHLAAAATPPPPGLRVLQLPPLHEGRRLVTRALLAWARRHGVHVHLWTIDDPAEMDAWIAAGIDGIVTDRPGLLVERIGRAAR